MLSLIPAPVHRLLLPVAHRMRHYWRKWRKPQLRGVSAILTDISGGVLLVRHSYGADVWSLPGGGIGRDESPSDAIRRELREELGVSLSSVHCLGEIEETISGSPHTAFIFTAMCDEHPQPDGREVIEARFFAAHSLPEPLSERARTRLALWRERTVA